MNLNRRTFFLASTGLLGSTLLHSRLGAADTPGATGSGLRTITYNILAAKGYPETETNRELLRRARPQMVQRLAHELALYDPDVITFQESPAEEVVAAIARALGYRHTYFPGGFPGAVLTRFKIVESRNCPLVEGERPPDLFTRHWGRAVLEQNGRRLMVYSAHLHPSNPGVRAREVTAALAVMAADIAGAVPMLFLGDLNHGQDDPEYARWQAAGLVDLVPADGAPRPLTFPSTEPKWCIDFSWANPVLARRRTSARVLFEGAFRTNPVDERSFALSDHLPVLAEFSGDW
jgi:endonuclease/exonuclease/phosphatase family metal-dependent hydrolase